MNNEVNKEKEVTLKDLILTIKKFGSHIIRKWYIIALVCFITTAGFIFKHKTHEVTYPATLRFVVEGQDGGGGSLGSLLGSFGIKKGSKVNPFKILEVGKSTSILKKILLQKDEQGIYLGDRIIEELQIVNPETEADARLVDFGMKDFKDESEVSNKLLKRMRARIWGGLDGSNSIASLTFNDDAGIFTMRVESVSQELSVEISHSVYNAVKLFFEEEIFLNQKKTAQILKNKMDSLKVVRDQLIEQVARAQDRNRNTITNSGTVGVSKLSYDLKATGLAYSEVVKNYELTDINLRDIQPIFMAIDMPFRPLPPIESSLILNIIFGLFIGTFLGIIIITLRKIYTDTMNA